MSEFKHPLAHYRMLWVLLVLWLAAWIGQTIAQYYEVHHDAVARGDVFQWREFWIIWFRTTLENWQSEFLQLFTFTFLTVWLISHRAPQSRESVPITSTELEIIDAKLNAVALKLGIEPGEVERMVTESKL